MESSSKKHETQVEIEKVMGKVILIIVLIMVVGALVSVFFGSSYEERMQDRHAEISLLASSGDWPSLQNEYEKIARSIGQKETADTIISLVFQLGIEPGIEYFEQLMYSAPESHTTKSIIGSAIGKRAAFSVPDLITLYLVSVELWERPNLPEIVELINIQDLVHRDAAVQKAVEELKSIEEQDYSLTWNIGMKSYDLKTLFYSKYKYSSQSLIENMSDLLANINYLDYSTLAPLLNSRIKREDWSGALSLTALLDSTNTDVKRLNTLLASFASASNYQGLTIEEIEAKINKFNCDWIVGDIIAELDPDPAFGLPQYEIRLRYASTNAILLTTQTRFQSSGRFDMQVKKLPGQVAVKVRGGFTQYWDRYAESLDCNSDSLRYYERKKATIHDARQKLEEKWDSMVVELEDVLAGLD